MTPLRPAPPPPPDDKTDDNTDGKHDARGNDAG
jgi:hypothetical protein